MDDLISRQEAIDLLKEEEYPCESDYDEGYMAALDKAVWIIEKWLPSAQPDVPDKNVGDMISRQAAIDEVRNYYDPEDTSVTSIEDRIKRLPSAQPQWIPCSERLPEDYEDVLVWFEYFRYGDYNRLYQTHGIGDYSSEYDSWMINHESGWSKLRVFAWMPLPEPWKGEQP